MFCLLPLLFATAGSCCPSLPHWVRIWGQPGKSIALGRKMGAARGIYHTGSVYGDDPGNIYLTGSVYRSGQGNLPHWVSIWGRSGKSTALSQYMGTVREICRTASVYGDGPGNLHISLGQYMGTARGIYRTGSVYGGRQGNISHWVSIWERPGEYISLGQYMEAAWGNLSHGVSIWRSLRNRSHGHRGRQDKVTAVAARRPQEAPPLTSSGTGTGSGTARSLLASRRHDSPGIVCGVNAGFLFPN